MEPGLSHLVVIGASAGGVRALLALAKALPRAFAAPICVVQHVGSNASMLPQLLRHKRPNHAVHAEDGQRLATGTLHIAPPDHHMLVDGNVLRLTHGPKENHARPAIDPLFRSAALAWGSRVIGVILTGQMDDGAAGLRAIKDRGGIAIVQDPATAVEPSMPASALASVDADYCVPLEEIGPLLQRLVGAPAPEPAGPPPEDLVTEVAINRGEATVENLRAIANPSFLTCPDCGGTLAKVKKTVPLRYRCHTGHAFTALTLAKLQQDTAEQALWNSVRALVEREILLRRLAAVASATGEAAQAAAGTTEADRLHEQIMVLQGFARAPRPGAEEESPP